jgi:hypothetical protein
MWKDYNARKINEKKNDEKEKKGKLRENLKNTEETAVRKVTETSRK